MAPLVAATARSHYFITENGFTNIYLDPIETSATATIFFCDFTAFYIFGLKMSQNDVPKSMAAGTSPQTRGTSSAPPDP